jgi:hypothetical protein
MEWRSAIQKLRTMGPGEIRARANDWAFAIYERRQIARARAPHNARRPDVRFSPGISGGRFFASMQQPDRLRAALEGTFAEETAETIARADAVLDGRITLFSRSYDLGSTIDWHADPPTRWKWPLVYHRDVFNAACPPGVDVKHVWELNRQQFLVDLATAWLVTRRSAYLDAVRSVVLGWVDQNPVGMGVNWAGPLEVAYRALSWLWAAHLVDDGLDHSDALRAAWASSLQEHAAFLHRHLELYSSPYNHLISEASVLFVLGLVFPQWPEADRWQARGRRVLEERLGAQFYADGGSVEQAVGYHHATLGFYLLAALVARHNRDGLSPQVWQAIERAIEWSMWTMQPDGQQPAIGDNDDARPIRFSSLGTWDYRHFQSLGAVLFARRDFKALAGRWHQEGEWLLDAGGRARFEALHAARPAQRSVSLATSGYVVLRSGCDPRSDYVCFDVGEMAGGLRTDEVPSAAHGHADCLSVVVVVRGIPVFVDAGFYSYNADPHWERWFRDTEAHNTMRVDGRAQATYLGKMTWASVPRATLDDSRLDHRAGVLWARGTHDGYARGERPVRHTRTVVLKPGVCVAIFDELAGDDDHTFEIGFLCAPERRVVRGGADLAIDQLAMRITANVAIEVRTASGETDGNTGWVAPSLDVRQPATRIVASGRHHAPLTQVLTLVAHRPSTAGDRLIADDEWPAEIREAAVALAGLRG